MKTAWLRWLALLLLAGAVGLVYGNSLTGPFLFDDVDSIPGNPTIRDLRDWRAVLSPPATGITVQGRPLANLTFALNYAWSGTSVAGYHLVNLLIHLLASWTLFGLVRRTMGLPGMPTHWRQRALPIALATALIWAVHPLATAAVTYTVQRAESLMALCYLLTLYALCRAQPSRRPGAWLAVSAVACLLGTATKEAMASAPLMALLYDRIFLSGSFRASLRRRTGYYLALAASWVLLAWLVLGSGSRGGTVGLTSHVGVWAYLRTQPVAICTYLKLVFWPNPLIFDYGAVVETSLWRILPATLAVAALWAVVAVGLWKAPRAAYAGLLFFAVLAPTSSFIPVATQTMAEHRMYLPLAAVVLLAVMAVVWISDRFVAWNEPWRSLSGFGLLAVAALALGLASHSRNSLYGDPLRLWSDTVAKRPGNARAWYCLSLADLAAGRPEEALQAGMEACRIPIRQGLQMAENQNNLANILCSMGRHEESLEHYREAIRLDPDSAFMHSNYGKALGVLGRPEEAMAEHRIAVRLQPDYALAHFNMAGTLMQLHRPDEALAATKRAVELNPDLLQAYHYMGDSLRELGRPEESLACYREILRRQPGTFPAALRLGVTLIQLGRAAEAQSILAAAARRSPDPATALREFASALVAEGYPAEARALSRRAEIRGGF